MARRGRLRLPGGLVRVAWAQAASLPYLVAENAEKLPPVFVHKVTLEPAFSGCVELFIPANLGLSLQPEFDVATSGAAVLLP
jgi:hypothetical protein